MNLKLAGRLPDVGRLISAGCLALLLAASLAAQGGFSGPGDYTLINVNSGKALELDSRDGISVIQFDLRHTDNQVWRVEAGPGGSWMLRNLGNGRALEASGAAGGGQVRGATPGRTAQQYWRIEAGPGGAAVLVAFNGGVLDVPGAARQNGVRLQTWERNDTPAQLWSFHRVASGPFARGDSRGAARSALERYEIVNVNSGKVLDLDRNDRTTILQFEARGTDNQIWELRNAGIGQYYIVNTMNQYALEAMGSGVGAGVRAAPLREADSQKWRAEPFGDAYLLISSFGNVLDVPQAQTGNGVRLHLWERNNTRAQQWRFRPVSDGTSPWPQNAQPGWADENSPLTPWRGGSTNLERPGAREGDPPAAGRGGGARSGGLGTAVDACQADVRAKLGAQFGNAAVSFQTAETAMLSAAQIGVRGRGLLRSTTQTSAFEYQCVVNARSGRLLTSNYRMADR